MTTQRTQTGKRIMHAPIDFAGEFGISNVDACIRIATLTARALRRERTPDLATRAGGEFILKRAREVAAATTGEPHVNGYFAFIDAKVKTGRHPNAARYPNRIRGEVRRALNVGASAVAEDGWSERAHRGEQSAARLTDARGKVIARPADRLTAADVKPAAPAKPAAAKPAAPAAKPAKPATAKRAAKPATASKPAPRRPGRAK